MRETAETAGTETTKTETTPKEAGALQRPGVLRVMTMNVLAPGYADGEARRAVLREEVRRLAPDVLALQEVTRREADGLAADGWHVVPHPAWGPDGVGAVLAARLPFGARASDRLAVTERTSRTPWCGVVVAGLPLPEPLGTVVLVHHKPSWPYGFERERELQAVAAARLAEELRERCGARHTVLLGDLDAPPEAASLRFLRGLASLEGTSVCHQDAWEAVHPGEPGWTFSPRNPLVRDGDMPEEAGRRIDHILVGCGPCGPGLHIARCERVLTGPVDGVQASDHYGLFADLIPPHHPPGRWAGE